MALISYYNQPTGSNTIDLIKSPYAQAHNFNMEITGLPSNKELTRMYKPNGNIITGFLEEIPEIKYSTSWGDSPVAVINEKIKKFTQNKWIKMFAIQNNNYKPPLMTDGWTQQFPKAAEPLSISFKFRSYPIEMYNTTDFKEIIDLLIFVTAPKEFNLTNTMEYMGTAGQEAKIQGGNFGKAVNNLKDALNNADVDLKTLAKYYATPNRHGNTGSMNIESNTAKVINAIDKFFELIEGIGNMEKANVGGCPLIKLQINDLINASEKIKWILKSWSFKPAINVTDNNKPIYVDFNISLQTQYILSTKDLSKILNV
jgi:hypothetical protein